MLQVIRNVSLILLALIYLTASYAMVISLTSPFCALSEQEKLMTPLVPQNGKSNSALQAKWAQHRHLPLVKQFSMLSAAVSTLEYIPHTVNEYFVIHSLDHTHLYLSFDSSLLCDRAPPLSQSNPYMFDCGSKRPIELF